MTNIDDIRAEFLRAFETRSRYTSQVGPSKPLRNPPNHAFFPLHCLHELRDLVRDEARGDRTYSNEAENDDFTENYGARFAVNLNNQIRFTREGPRSRKVPVHDDIYTEVLTAGNVYFSENYATIVKITNKSGHFQPDFGTLVFALPLIVAAGFPLADEVTLKNESTAESISLSKEELQSLTPDAYDLASIMIKNASMDVIVSPSSESRMLPALAFASMFADAPSQTGITRTVHEISGYESPDDHDLKKFRLK